MASVNLRESLTKIGEPRPGDPIPPLMSGFVTAPPSLRTAMQAMSDPRMSEWELRSEEFIEDDWGADMQGIAYSSDDDVWVFSTNETSDASEIGGPYRPINSQKIYARRGSDIVASVDVGKICKDILGSIDGDEFIKIVKDEDGQWHDQYSRPAHLHLGDIDAYGGRIYAAVERMPPRPNELFEIATSLDSTTATVTPLPSLPSKLDAQTLMPWCAINPLDGLLYTSNFDSTQVNAYDPAAGCAYRKTLTLGVPVSKIQGGCFSSNGHLYLSSDEGAWVHAFSVLNGHYYGAFSFVKEGLGQEVEGMCFAPAVAGNGAHVQLHVILYEGVDGDFYLKHFGAADPSVI